MSNLGKIWKSERAVTKDRISGVEVQRLTGHLGHSHHFYFTNPGWWGGGRRLLFGSDRGNCTNLFSIELSSGEITQLTDFSQSTRYPASEGLLYSSVNPRRAEAYLWHERELLALDLHSLKTRPLYRVPDGFSLNITNVSADGAAVLTGIYEDLSSKFDMNLLHGYVGFREMFEAHPLSKIVEIQTDGSGSRVLHEERNWIGHVNTSPTQSNLVSFCHEGPWERVDCRMWMLDRNSGKVWKLRPTEKGETVGHEYWLADGVHLGFHGVTKTGKGAHVYGWVRFDNTGLVEAPFPKGSNHFHSNTKDLIVGDGNPQDDKVYLWAFQNGEFSQPRILCQHRCSFHIQQTHVHPRFSPEGTYVLYTSDDLGYGNLYRINLPEFETLPKA
jgi:oligogalacturonide lyase